MDVLPQVALSSESGVARPVMTFGLPATLATYEAQLAQRGKDRTDQEFTFVPRSNLDLIEVRGESEIPLAPGNRWG